MTEITFDWTPTVGIGPFKFGEPISTCVESGLIEFCPDLSDDGERDCYQTVGDEDPWVSAYEDGAVHDVSTDRHLFYRGQDLLGLHIDEVIKILGQAPDEFSDPMELDDDDIQITAEFDALGLQLWLRDGVAVTAYVGPFIDD